MIFLKKISSRRQEAGGSQRSSVIGYRLSVIGRQSVVKTLYRIIINYKLWTMVCGLSLFSFQLQTPNSKQQTSNFKLIRSISIDAKDIQTDRLGNLYIVTKANQLYKYDSRGNLLGTLNYKYVGNISDVDATNPLEIYVFYKELNKILFLDNNLAYRGEVDLNDYNISQVSAIARSYDNGIWVFDASDLQLKRLNKTGGILQQSGNVKQFVNAAITPNFIYDNNDRVFMNDSATGIHVFNVFANYIKTISIKGCNEFKIIEDDLFYNKGKKLMRYNLKSFSETEFSLPDTSFIVNISIEKERLFLFKPSGVEIYLY